MERVERGETLTVTRSGVPVGELRPLPHLESPRKHCYSGGGLYR